MFKDETTDEHGRALWSRLKPLSGDPAGRNEILADLARKRGITNVQVGMGKAGRFRPFDGILVTGTPSPILLPIESPDEILRKYQTSLLDARMFLRKVEWFYPAYKMKRFVHEVERLVDAKGTDWKDAFEICLAVAYTPDYIATMLTDRYRAIPEIEPFVTCIQESTEAFYFGFVATAVASLIPAVEGALSKMLLAFRSRQDQTGAELVTQVVNAAIEAAASKVVYQKHWVPKEYRERVFLIHMDEYVELLDEFERFCRDSFFAHTDSYSGSAVNRHAVLHAVITNHGKPANFFRLISILDLIAFIGSMNISGVSCLAPNDTDASRSLAVRFKALALMGTAYRLQAFHRPAS